MESLEHLMNAAAGIATQITTPSNMAEVEAKLRSTLALFPLSGTHAFPNAGTGPGLYFIEIKFPFRTEEGLIDFVGRWGTKGGDGLQKATSRSYANRAKRHLQKVKAGEFVPLYLGKNKNVRSRLIQHLTGKTDAATYGLKLLSRSAVLEGCQLRAGAVDFTINRDAYFCIALLEAALRDKIHPIVGKQ